MSPSHAPRRLFARPAGRHGLYRRWPSTTRAASPSSPPCAGRAGRDIVDTRLTALLNLDHRGAVGAEQDRRRRRHPHADPRRVPARRRRRRAARRRALRDRHGLPAGRRGEQRAARSRRSSRSPPRRSSTCSGWREVAGDRRPRRRDRARLHAGLPPAVRRRGRRASCPASTSTGAPSGCASAPSASPTCTSRRCRRAPSSTRACSRPASSSRSSRTCRDPRFASEIALVHSRFSTNTFPSWPLRAAVPDDRPQRRDQHRPRQPQLDGRPREPADQRHLRATSSRCSRSARPTASDSGSFDEVLELLHLGGRSLPHAVLMMIPEAWENHAEMDPARRAFYEYHSTFMEPWDGPACVTFTDGTLIGAVHDRNGLRPGRYWVTEDGLVVLASEAGVLDIDPATVVQGPARARPDVPRRHRARPDHRRRGDQVLARGAASVRRVAARRAPRPGAAARARARRCTRRRRSRVASRPSGTPRRSCRSCSPRWPGAGGEAARLDGHGHARSRCCPPGRGCSSTTSRSCSRR